MAAPTIPNGEEHFFPIIYEGNGTGQRVGNFVPFTDNGTIANSLIFDAPSDVGLTRTPSSAGNSKTFTVSVWAKRCGLGDVSGNNTYGQRIFNAGSTGPSNFFDIKWSGTGDTEGANRLHIREYSSSAEQIEYWTNRTFEDTSKWYHILLAVDTTQSTSGDRIKLYVDGDQITSWYRSNAPSLNFDTRVNSTTLHNIGKFTGATTNNLDGYLAEFNLVDGSALTPDTFGLTDTSTGRWIPKTLTGITYGTNGFRLQFGSTSNFGDDTSGNTNDFSVTNLVASDQTTDSPTQNFNTFGSIYSGVTVSKGNLTVNTGTSGSYIQAVGQPAFGVATGKWYWEVKITTVGKALYGWKDDGSQGGSQANQGGTSASGNLSTGSSGSFSAGSWFIDMDYSNEVNYTTVSTNDILMFAIDLDTGKGYCGKNGTFFNSANPANGTGEIGGCHRANGINKFYPCANRLDTASVGEFNFGQKSFAYTPPTGFSALQQDNLPETAKGVSGLSWIKSRDTASAHMLFDSSRGAQLRIKSDSTSSETTSEGTVTKFLKGGYAVGDQTSVNKSGDSVCSWNWVANGGTTASNGNGSISSTVQANTTAGFSIVQYTGNRSSGATIGHGLSQAPEVIITKNLDATYNWIIYFKQQGANKYGYLNLTNTWVTDTTGFNNVEPTSSVFTVGSAYESNGTHSMVAYCFHSVAGYSKMGNYTGNGVADGPFVYTGFKPRFIIHKGIDIASNGRLIDSVRNPFNPVTQELYTDTTGVEYNMGTRGTDFLSNGFKIRQESGYGMNNSGVNYFYMAFAEHPFVGDGTNPVTAR